MKKYPWMPFFILLAVALGFAAPVLKNIHYWGHMDWDQFTFWHAVPRETILKYRQFPLWNPYVNGGNVLLAHPHSAFLSPFFICVLIWGPVIGLKLEIVLHLFAGLTGMYTLSRYMKMNERAAYLSSFVYMLSSIFPLHLGEGQAEWLSLAFVPWFFLFFLKTIDADMARRTVTAESSGRTDLASGPVRHGNPLAGIKNFTAAVFFLGMILVSGVYVFNILFVFLCLYSLLKSVREKSPAPLKIFSVILLGACLLCAVKLLPMLEFLNQYPRLIDQKSGLGWDTLGTMLFSRQQALLDMRLWETVLLETGEYQYGWHEYGAYVGFLPFFLFLYGVFKRYKKNWPLILTAVICLLIVLGARAPVNIWGFLRHFPVYKSLTVPSRFIFCFIFPFALLAGWGLFCLESYLPQRAKSLSVMIVLLVLTDLWQVNAPIFKNVFRIPPVKVSSAGEFRQRYDKINFYEDKDINRSSQYPVFLSHSGILDAYECVQVKRGDVRALTDPGYRGEIYFKDNKGDILSQQFSPNKITVDIETEEQDVLVINQNYYRGWRLRYNGRKQQPVSYNGLIAASVPPGRHRIIFYYLPWSFILGLGVSLAFIGGILFCFIKNSQYRG